MFNIIYTNVNSLLNCSNYKRYKLPELLTYGLSVI